MQTPKITVQTLAYNMETYIEQCIQSVLDQSFSDFEWIIIDNGSTDRTTAIIEEYAKRDSRIRIVRRARNSIVYNENLHEDFYGHLRDLKSDYWCVLDSDDYVHRDFLHELYSAAVQWDADIAVGGTRMFKEENPSMYGDRCPPDLRVAEASDIGDVFPEIYGCFRPLWGKLFRSALVKSQLAARSDDPLVPKNGTDTIFSLDCLGLSRRIVAVNKVLHYYRIRKSSLYHSRLDVDRYINYRVIFDESRDLLEKWDKLTERNYKFITDVLIVSLKDCLEIAENSNVPIDKKLQVIEAMLTDEKLYNCLAHKAAWGGLLAEVQKTFRKITQNLSFDDLMLAMPYFSFRLFHSLQAVNETRSLDSKLSSFALYASALFDRNNKLQAGQELLYAFLTAIGKRELKALSDHGIEPKVLLSDADKFMAVLNGSIQRFGQIQLKDHTETVSGLKRALNKYLIDEQYDIAVDVLLEALRYAPLDKELLEYKLYLLVLNGDQAAALESAQILAVFYPQDVSALILVGQTYSFIGDNNKAKEVLEYALSICTDKDKHSEIVKEIESLELS